MTPSIPKGERSDLLAGRADVFYIAEMEWSPYPGRRRVRAKHGGRIVGYVPDETAASWAEVRRLVIAARMLL